MCDIVVVLTLYQELSLVHSCPCVEAEVWSGLSVTGCGVCRS